MIYSLRIIHLSDLHERVALDWMDADRKDLIRREEASRCRVLGSNFLEILNNVGKQRKINLICFTGDVADWGLKEEYQQATLFFSDILKTTGVAADHLFIVPGNHDVCRKVAEDSWQKLRHFGSRNQIELSEWMMARGHKCPQGADPTWREDILKRSNSFWQWVTNDLKRDILNPLNHQHTRLGYQIKLDDLGFPFDVHIIGLDSAWLAGEDDDRSYLQLTESQVDLLSHDKGEPFHGFRVALVHHPLSDLLDETRSFNRLANMVDLLLHGHQHDEIIETQINPDRNLYCFAAGSLYEHEKYLNSFHVIDIQLNELGNPLCFEIEFWGWSDKEHWFRIGTFFKAASEGRYTLVTELGKKSGLFNQKVKTIGNKTRNDASFFDNHFKDRVEQCNKTYSILADNSKKLICIFGYPGMGKTTMVEKVLWNIEKGAWPQELLINNWDGIVYLQNEELKFDILFDRIKDISSADTQQELETIRKSNQDIEKKINKLLEALNKGRFIVLLDGIDELLDENGKFKKEYGDFNLFCEMAIKQSAESKIILTSTKPLELDEPFLQTNTHQEKLSTGLPENDAISYFQELDSMGKMKYTSDEDLANIVKITYGIPRALQLIYHILSEAKNSELTVEMIVNQFYKMDEVVKSLVAISNAGLDNTSRQVVEVLSVFNRPVPAKAISFVMQTPSNDVNETIEKLAETHLINWDRNPKGVAVYSLHPIDKEYSYNLIPETGTTNNRSELHLRAANYYKSLGETDEWKEIKTIDHPKVYEYEQRLKASDYDGAAQVIDSIDYSWTNHHKYLAHLMALGYGGDSIQRREKLIDKLSTPAKEAFNRTSLGWVCRRMGRKKDAAKHLSDAVTLAFKDTDITAQIYALSEQGYFLTDNAGEHDEAEAVLRKALQISQEMGDFYSKAHIYLGLAFADFQRPQHNSSSLENTRLSLDLFEQVNTRLSLFRQIDCWVRLGMIHRKMGNYPEALRTAVEGLKLAEKNGLIDWDAELYSGLGFHQRAQGLWLQAIESHTKALDLFREKCGMKREEAVQHSYLANLYTELGSFDDALNSFNKAEKLAKDYGFRRELSWILSNKGILYYKLGDFENALNFQKSGLAIVKENNHLDSQVIRYTDLAATYLRMEQYRNAESFLWNAMQCASQDAKINLPANFPALYLDSDALEDKLPHEMQTPDDHIRRGIILARIYLHSGKMSEACDIIRFVNIKQNQLSPHKHITKVLLGLILHNCESSEEAARKAYEDAIETVNEILLEVPTYFVAIFSKGLALAGLSLLSKGEKSRQLKKKAKETYLEGLKICSADGVKKDALLLLKKLPADQKFIRQVFPA